MRVCEKARGREGGRSCGRVGGRRGGREGGREKTVTREGGQSWDRNGGRTGAQEGGCEGGRAGGWEGGHEGGREGGPEGRAVLSSFTSCRRLLQAEEGRGVPQEGYYNVPWSFYKAGGRRDHSEVFYKWREVITRRAMPRSILGGVLQRSGCSTRRAGGVIVPRAFYKLREVITSRGRPRRAAGGITTYLVVLQVGRAARSFRGILRAAGGLYKPGDAEEHPRSSSTMRESFYKVGRSAWRLRDVLQACESLVQAGESRGASRDGYYNLLDVLQPRQARRRHMGSVLQGIYKARGQQSSTIVGGIYKH